MCEISFSASSLPVCVCASKIENGKITRMKRREKKPIEQKSKKTNIKSTERNLERQRLEKRTKRANKKEKKKKTYYRFLVRIFWCLFDTWMCCCCFFLSRFLCFSSLFLPSCLQPLIDVFVCGIFFSSSSSCSALHEGAKKHSLVLVLWFWLCVHTIVSVQSFGLCSCQSSTKCTKNVSKFIQCFLRTKCFLNLNRGRRRKQTKRPKTGRLIWILKSARKEHIPKYALRLVQRSLTHKETYTNGIRLFIFWFLHIHRSKLNSMQIVFGFCVCLSLPCLGVWIWSSFGIVRFTVKITLACLPNRHDVFIFIIVIIR